MFAGIERGNEVFRVQMLRRGDQDGVDGFIVEQVAVIKKRLRAGHGFLGFLEALGIDVGEGGHFRVGAGDGFAHQLHAAIARADQAQADAAVRAQNTSSG